MITVQRQSPVPLYYQISNYILEKIASGELKPDERIPSEGDLSSIFHVSRMTAREAITRLVNEGILYRKQGKGTFVSQPRIERQTNRLTGFFEDMLERGLRPSSKVFEIEVIGADRHVSKLLHLNEGEPAIRIRRLRLANDEPMAFQVVHLPEKLCPQLVQEDLSSQSLYGLLEKKYGLRLVRAEERIQAVKAGVREAALLGKRDLPLLAIERVTYLADDVPIELVNTLYRGDRYVYHTIAYR